MKPHLLILLATASLLMLGCASDATFLQTGQARAPISPERIRVYGAPPPHYQEVGVVSFSDTSHFSRRRLQIGVIRRLKKQASRKGANGLVITEMHHAGGSNMFRSKGETIKALAIYVP